MNNLTLTFIHQNRVSEWNDKAQQRTERRLSVLTLFRCNTEITEWSRAVPSSNKI